MKLFFVAGEPTAWEFDELAHAGAEHLDSAYVAAYDEKSPTNWSEEVAELLSLGVDATSTVVDIGAGTGTFARSMAPHVARVVAVDVSEAMVAAMRRDGVEAVRAGFLSYEHEGGAPDAVMSRNALHHLPDFWKAIALERIARLLRPGGVLLLQDIVYSFEPADASDAFAAWFDSAPSIPRKVGQPSNWLSTFGTNTRRSAGCSNRCLSGSALRSVRGARAKALPMPPTHASGASRGGPGTFPNAGTGGMHLCRFSAAFTSRSDESFDGDTDRVRADGLVEIEVVVSPG